MYCASKLQYQRTMCLTFPVLTSEFASVNIPPFIHYEKKYPEAKRSSIIYVHVASLQL